MSNDLKNKIKNAMINMKVGAASTCGVAAMIIFAFGLYLFTS